MTRRKTHEEFVAEVKALVGDEYEVLGKYSKNDVHVKMKHINCSHIYDVTPSNILNGRKCPKCFGSKRKTTYQHKLELKLKNPSFEVISEYTNCNTNVTYRCASCLNQFDMLPNNALKGQGCPFCAGKRESFHSKFMRYFVHNAGDEYVLISETILYEEKIEIKHLNCKNTYFVRGTDFMRGNRCPKCFGKNKKTTAQFSKEVFLADSEYLLISEYKNAHKKVVILHKKCRNSYEVSPSAFLRGNRCPKCSESKGERKIREWLDERQIAFSAQEPVKYDARKAPLKFDFYVQGISIEYDGKQHFEPVERFGGDQGFRETQRRDAIKNKYCADNGIPLIRIPYWEYDNIDAILTEKLLPMLKDSAA